MTVILPGARRQRAMRITEVVRGEDLLDSTARRHLINEARGAVPRRFYHCPLVLDESGHRLTKLAMH
jgi:glutamyl/glutaminyl-tRNA synthetase